MKPAYCIAFLLIALTSCTDPVPDSEKPMVDEPKQLSYTVTATYPHNSTSFTEGLEYRDGFLYEGTGESNGYNGTSKLAKVDLKTGKDVQKVGLGKEYFGEGITILNGKIYQMTYKEQKCFLYDAKTFAKLKEFTYDGQGWGLTNDGKQLIMSNGSSNLFFRDPETFAVTKTLKVTNNYGELPAETINELEYVDGYVYANIWMSNKIIKIDVNTGKVAAEIKLDDLLQKYAPEVLEQEPKVDVLNGIAYDSAGKRFFITGKLYPKVFEVKFN
jgi:glutamine cyclotransferase